MQVPSRLLRPFTTTSTCSAIRSTAGTRWTSARRRCTAARRSGRSASTGRRTSSPRPERLMQAPARSSAGGEAPMRPTKAQAMRRSTTRSKSSEAGRFELAVMRYREALNQALREEMERDEAVFLMGEDVGVFQGAFKVTVGLLEEFGERRVRDTPISENTIVGMGVGAAMTGLRPVVELMTVNFAFLALDQILTSAAHIHYMFGGQAKVPLVIRFPQGGGHQLGPTPSHTMEGMFLHVPGLLVAVPSTAADARGLLKTAIRDDNPVIFIEHETLYGVRGEVPEHVEVMRLGEAAIRRDVTDLTI